MYIIVALWILEFSGVVGYWVQSSVVVGLRANGSDGIVSGVYLDCDGSLRVKVL